MYLLIAKKHGADRYQQVLQADLPPHVKKIDVNARARLPDGFPLLINGNGSLHWACFCYLLDKYRIDPTRDRHRTLQTYAEGMKDWLQHLEDQGWDWTKPPAVALSDFRGAIAQGVGRTKRGAHSTINLRTAIVKDFYSFLESWTGWRLHEPSLEIDPPPIARFLHAALRIRATKAYKKVPRSLSVREMEEISSHLKMPYSLIFRWSIATGLRRTSVTSLTVSQLPSKIDQIGYLELAVKGGKRIEVPVTPNLLDATWEYVRTVRPRVLSNSRMVTDQLFIGSSGRPVTSRAYYSAFRHAARCAGIKASPHCTRHTFAVHMNSALERSANKGGRVNPVKVIQHLLGHSSPATTELYLESISAVDLDVLRALIEVQGITYDP